VTEIGLVVALVVGAAALLVAAFGGWNPDRGRVRRRLVAELAGPVPAAGALYKNRNDLHADPTDEDGAGVSGVRLFRRVTSLRGRLADLLEKAGVALTPRQFLLVVVAAGGGLGGLAAVFGGPLAGVAVGVVAAVVPFALVGVRRKARQDKYRRQLVGAFESLIRALRAGQTVLEGFRAVTDGAEQPLAGEFLRCQHQIEHGLRPEAAYRELSERTGVMEMRIFVVAMNVQRQTGGNLVDVLERLVGVVRARVRLKQKIRALTAEGRMQSAILTVLPIVTFAVMYFLNRGYAEQLLIRWQLLAATAGCMTVGLLWIRKIMSFEG
jgi:tight adherence protein B